MVLQQQQQQLLLLQVLLLLLPRVSLEVAISSQTLGTAWFFMKKCLLGPRDPVAGLYAAAAAAAAAALAAAAAAAAVAAATGIIPTLTPPN